MAFDRNKYINQDAINKAKNGGSEENLSDIFYKIKGDCVIRLLPQPNPNSDGGGVPFYKNLTHYLPKELQINGKQNAFGCLRNNTQSRNFSECPVCSRCWEMKDSSILDERKLSKACYAGTRYIFNAFIVKDSNAENQGKIKLISVGRELFDLIMQKAEETGNGIYDPENGFNLKIIVKSRKIENDSGPAKEIPHYNIILESMTSSKIANFEDILPQLHCIKDVISSETEEVLQKEFDFLWDLDIYNEKLLKVENEILKNKQKTESSVDKYDLGVDGKVSSGNVEIEDDELTNLINGKVNISDDVDVEEDIDDEEDPF